MSIIKKYSLFFLILFFSCTEKQADKFSVYAESQRDSIAEHYNEGANTFSQPSALYRIYKDSANLAKPNNVIYRQTLSYSYKKVGDHIKAMEILNKAVAQDTANGEVEALGYKIWSLLYFYRDYESVVQDVDLLRKIAKRNYSSCWGEPCGLLKGQALYKLKKYKEAINTLKEVNVEEEKLDFDTTGNFLVFFYTARCYAEMNMNDEAKAYYKKALHAANEKSPEVYYQLGRLFKSMDNPKQAKVNFELAHQYTNYKMGEPYIERFDEVFPYMIEKELEELNSL